MKDVWVVTPYGYQEKGMIFCQDRDHAIAVRAMMGEPAVSVYLFADRVLLGKDLYGSLGQYYDPETGHYQTFSCNTYSDFTREVQEAYAAWEAGQ
jgi:hypothetical protein